MHVYYLHVKHSYWLSWFYSNSYQSKGESQACFPDQRRRHSVNSVSSTQNAQLNWITSSWALIGFLSQQLTWDFREKFHNCTTYTTHQNLLRNSIRLIKGASVTGQQCQHSRNRFSSQNNQSVLTCSINSWKCLVPMKQMPVLCHIKQTKSFKNGRIR